MSAFVVAYVVGVLIAVILACVVTVSARALTMPSRHERCLASIARLELELGIDGNRSLYTGRSLTRPERVAQPYVPTPRASVPLDPSNLAANRKANRDMGREAMKRAAR